MPRPRSSDDKMRVTGMEFFGEERCVGQRCCREGIALPSPVPKGCSVLGGAFPADQGYGGSFPCQGLLWWDWSWGSERCWWVPVGVFLQPSLPRLQVAGLLQPCLVLRLPGLSLALQH